MVAVGIVRWVEFTVTEPSYFKLCTEHTPIHLALLDEVVTCHLLLHTKVLTLLIELFESKQDELEILVQVRRIVSPNSPKQISCGQQFLHFIKPFSVGNAKNVTR